MGMEPSESLVTTKVVASANIILMETNVINVEKAFIIFLVVKVIILI